MKGYLALCLVIVLSVGLTKSQRPSQKTSLDEKTVQGILENYNKNPTAESKSDLENAFRANCCDPHGLRMPPIPAGLRRQKRAGPICRWIRRAIAEVK